MSDFNSHALQTVWNHNYKDKKTMSKPTMTDAEALLQTGMTVYSTAKKLGVANSSLRFRIINGRRSITCRECGAVVPVRFGERYRVFCSLRCCRRWHSRNGARQRYAKKHGGNGTSSVSSAASNSLSRSAICAVVTVRQSAVITPQLLASGKNGIRQQNSFA